MQTNVKKKSFFLTSEEKKTFDLLKKAFQYAFILTHFESDFFIRFETNAFEFDISRIISQLQTNDQ